MKKKKKEDFIVYVVLLPPAFLHKISQVSPNVLAILASTVELNGSCHFNVFCSFVPFRSCMHVLVISIDVVILLLQHYVAANTPS